MSVSLCMLKRKQEKEISTDKNKNIIPTLQQIVSYLKHNFANLKTFYYTPRNKLF